MTGTDHETTDAVTLAVDWLAGDPRERIARPIVPFLRERFGISVQEAIEAIREANVRRARSQ